MLDDMVLRAGQRWEFIPCRLRGKPVYVWVTIPWKFTEKVDTK
jgi:outer membrane biosynthesis protein TonB